MESVAIPEHSIKLLPVAQPGVFDLVGYVISAGEGKPYQSVFYNGTIEVVKQGKLWRGMDVLIFNDTWKMGQIVQRHEQTGRLLQRDDHLARWVNAFVNPSKTKVFFNGVSPVHRWKGLGRANEVM
ncbi:Uncharacterized protein Rs2_28981 [Raphanus sativus]|nr:Uncharacterized protein Rs2_28981 [Raphanus sativus]